MTDRGKRTSFFKLGTQSILHHCSYYVVLVKANPEATPSQEVKK